MESQSIATGLRTLRKKSGLSQRELAYVLGSRSELSVVKHERSEAIPSLLTALAYEVIFQVPISSQFRGLYTSVEAAIEERLAELEQRLQQCDAKDRSAVVTARKLEFLNMRREPYSDYRLA